MPPPHKQRANAYLDLDDEHGVCAARMQQPHKVGQAVVGQQEASCHAEVGEARQHQTVPVHALPRRYDALTKVRA